MSPAEHPFAPFVRILGKGRTGTRALSFDEAHHAFGMILRGEVEPLQLGAFLMLLRVKEETAAELAGFVTACREFSGASPGVTAELDWSSYAGKRSQHPWYLLSALLLAENGVRVLMHGSAGHTPGRAYAQATLAELGVESAASMAEAGQHLDARGFAYISLQAFCSPLDDIMQLKPLLGLRSPVNTLARMLNPGRAPYSLQSVFHPNYAALHIDCDHLLGQANSMVFKGEGGECEIKPHARTRCHLLRAGVHGEFDWPRRIADRPDTVELPGAAALGALWAGADPDPYGETAVVETAAAALLLLERAESIGQAQGIAVDWWHKRDRGRL